MICPKIIRREAEKQPSFSLCCRLMSFPPSCPSPDPDPHTTGLLDWLKSCGASFSSVNFPCLHPQLGYRCALAKEAIEPHQPIVGIPFGCMVCVPNCLRNPQDSLGVLLREMWLNQTLGGDGLLALCISREVKRGEASSFYPYLVFLIETAEPGTISKWSESEREELQDGVISKRAGEVVETKSRRHDTTRHDTTRHDTTRHETSRHDKRNNVKRKSRPHV